MAALRKDPTSLLEKPQFVETIEVYGLAKVIMDPMIPTNFVQQLLPKWLYNSDSSCGNRSPKSRIENLLQSICLNVLDEGRLYWLINTAIDMNVSAEYRQVFHYIVKMLFL